MTSSAARTRGAATTPTAPWTPRRTCGRRGWRCGTTPTRRPWSSPCWKTGPDWRSGTNAAPSNDPTHTEDEETDMTTTMMVAADGVQDWLSDASDDVLKRIAAGAV